MSIALTLEDDIDISRGDMLASHDDIPNVGRSFEAEVVWMSETPVQLSRPLLLKHTTQTVRADIREVEYRIDLGTLDPEPSDVLGFNDIGRLRIETATPVFFDAYRLNRHMGSFILIDPDTNATLAAGMILHAVDHERRPESAMIPVTAAERMARYRHFGAVVRFGDRIGIGQALERRLFEEGCAVALLPGAGSALAGALQTQGLIVLLPGDTEGDLPSDDLAAADFLYARLQSDGVFLGELRNPSPIAPDRHGVPDWIYYRDSDRLDGRRRRHSHRARAHPFFRNGTGTERRDGVDLWRCD